MISRFHCTSRFRNLCVYSGIQDFRDFFLFYDGGFYQIYKMLGRFIISGFADGWLQSVPFAGIRKKVKVSVITPTSKSMMDT